MTKRKPTVAILPLPPKAETDKFCIPVELIPSGLKQLATWVLQNQDNYEDFRDECIAYIDTVIESIDDPATLDYYNRLMSKEAYNLFLEVSLENFYNCFLKSTRDIVGKDRFALVKVVSYRPNNAICVELEHGRTTGLPHHQFEGALGLLGSIIKKYRATHY